jgi:hypothetical protein
LYLPCWETPAPKWWQRDSQRTTGDQVPWKKDGLPGLRVTTEMSQKSKSRIPAGVLFSGACGIEAGDLLSKNATKD